ncbi:MAG: hypothetical protein ABW178_12385 [Pseudoxanthomonas sp.]
MMALGGFMRRLWGLSVLLAACAPLPPAWGDEPERNARPQAEWFACEQDAQCAVVFLNCQGWAAVGTRYQLAMERWYVTRNAALLRGTRCPGVGQSRLRPQAVCRVNACVAQ